MPVRMLFDSAPIIHATPVRIVFDSGQSYDGPTFRDSLHDAEMMAMDVFLAIAGRPVRLRVSDEIVT